MGNGSKGVCTRKEMIEKVKKVLDDMDNAKVEARCCCVDPDKPPPNTKVVTSACLDGTPGLPQLVTQQKEKYLWIPPPVDNRPLLDPSMSCYAATVANQFYDQYKGCRLDCGGAENSAPHSHWWNKTEAVKSGAAPPSPSSAPKDPDYCEDPSFVPPEPLGHQAWTYEPGGICRYPQYCKAACFDHTPERDWNRPY